VDIERGALLAELERAWQARVTVLAAPSGYGKTTLLAQYARRLGAAVIWVRLTEEDADSRGLMASVAQAASRLTDVGGWETVKREGRELQVQALAQDLDASASSFTFIVDQAEHLSGDSALALGALIASLDPNSGHRFLIAQHEGSAFRTPDGEGVQLGTQLLAFTAQDAERAAQALNQAGGSDDLLAASQGWPAGLMLALRVQGRAQGTLDASALLDALLLRVPGEVARELPVLAAADVWHEQVGTELGAELPEGWLPSLLRTGLPLTPLGEGRFAPHDVLRGYLGRQLESTPERLRRVYLRAGERSEAAGELYTAVRQYVYGGAVDRAVGIVETLAPGWYRAADYRLARETIALLPEEVRTAELHSYLALAQIETGEAASGAALAEAQVTREPTATAHLALALHAYRQGQWDAMGVHLDAGLKVAAQQRDVIQLLRFKVAHRTMRQNLPEALSLADEAVRQAEMIGEPSLRVSALSARGYVYLQLARLEDARRDLEQAYRQGTALALHNRLFTAVDNLVQVYLELNRAEAAARVLWPYLEACRVSYPLGVQHLRYRAAEVLHLEGQGEEAATLARNGFAELMALGNPHIAGNDLEWFFYTDLLGDRRAEAVRAFAQFRTLMGEDLQDYAGVLRLKGRTMQAYIDYLDGRMDRAQELIGQALTETHEVYGQTYLPALLLKAQMAWEQNELTEALAGEIAQELEQSGMSGVALRALHPKFLPLMEEFVRRGWHPETFQGKIRLCLTPPRGAAAAQIRVETLGRLRLTVNGQEVRVPAPTLEALVFVALGDDVTQDDVAREVWPDSELSRARASARTARNFLNRSLRQASLVTRAPLSEDVVQAEGRGGRVNPSWVLWADAALTVDVAELQAAQTPEEVARCLTGEFLPGSSNGWVLILREKLVRHAGQMLLQGAEHIEAQDPLQALRWLVKAADITQDPEMFERVAALAQRHGTADLTRAAQLAVDELSRGEAVTLSQWMPES